VSPEILLPRILILFGVGYLGANLVLIADLLRYRLRKRTALLTWQNPKPRYYGVSLLLGVALGFLIAFKLFGQRRPPSNVFGEAMMFVYYGYTFPLTTRIARGFYQDGIWSDTGFMPWGQIAAVSWESGPKALGPGPSVWGGPEAAPGQGEGPRHPHRGRRAEPGEPG
jgi:hypothetical protein